MDFLVINVLYLFNLVKKIKFYLSKNGQFILKLFKIISALSGVISFLILVIRNLYITIWSYIYCNVTYICGNIKRLIIRLKMESFYFY